jgi:hypothetical protein
VGSLRSQSRRAAAQRLALGHWRNWSNGSVRASLVQHALGEFTGPGPVLVSTDDNLVGRGIRASRGQQRLPVAVDHELIMAMCCIAIQASRPP